MGKGLISYSDRRIKKNEKDFLALPLIYHIKPRNYDYKENNANSFGFIAQEMEEVLPQLVITGKGDIINDEGQKEEVEDFKSIDYNQLIAINTQAIKELMENQKKLYEMILEIKDAIKNIKPD
jgi:Chaperone of endosialidase